MKGERVNADAPPRLHLVESFLNSVDVSSGRDDLATVAGFRRWLRDHDLGVRGRIGRDDLAWARELRAELRAVAAGHHDVREAHDTEALNRLAARAKVRVVFDPHGGAAVRPAGDGAAGLLAEVVAAIAVATTDGRWPRL